MELSVEVLLIIESSFLNKKVKEQLDQTGMKCFYHEIHSVNQLSVSNVQQMDLVITEYTLDLSEKNNLLKNFKKMASCVPWMVVGVPADPHVHRSMLQEGASACIEETQISCLGLVVKELILKTQLRLNALTNQDCPPKLITRETLINDVVQHAPIGVFHSTEQGRFLDVNPYLVNLLGYSSTDDLINSVNDLAVDVYLDPTQRSKIGEKLLKTHAWVSEEVKWKRKDGSIITVALAGRQILDETGKLICLEALIENITEQKLAQETLALSEARLLEAQSVSHTGSWDLDLIHKEMWGSVEAHRIYGLDMAPGMHLPLEIAQGLVESEYRPMMDKALTDLVSSGGKIPYDVEFYIHRQHDGERRAIHSRARLVADETGRPLRVAGTIQDITERKKIEEDIRNLNAELERRVRERTAQLEAANQELEAFSYSVSHDLRSPLRALNGYSSVLLNLYQERLDETGRNYLTQIQEATNRMDHLINDMLNLSRVTRTEMEHDQVDLSQLAREIIQDLKEKEPHRVIKVVIADNLLAQGDVNLLKIVLENLLNNAWKFTARCASQALIEAGSLIESGESVFFIRDNGAGFDMLHQDKLFMPFQRLHGAEEFPGTGIGLSIVQRIIQRHHGKVWAESKPGQGATFYFTLGKKEL